MRRSVRTQCLLHVASFFAFLFAASCGDASDAPATSGSDASPGAAPSDGGAGADGSSSTHDDASGGDDGAGDPADSGSQNGGFDGSIPSCPYTDDAQFCACLGATCGGDTVKDNSGAFHAVYCGTCQSPGYCGAFASPLGGALGTCHSGGGLDNVQKQKAEMMTSIWENGTPVLQYGYSKDIGDGRGYTNGRAGFCTGTGDAILVIECYDLVEAGNAMQKYMPALVAINDQFAASNGIKIQSTTNTLGNWTSDWKSSAGDAAFKKCQDGVSDAVYYGVSLRHVNEKKFTTALTKAALYDAQLNQGEADPRFGMLTMMAQADQMTGAMADPPTLQDEDKWLDNFLTIRDGIMKKYPEWAGNRYRVSTYQKLRAAGNWDLTKCIVTDSSVYTIVTQGNAAQATSGSHCP
jgi:hypothetical protein